MNRALTLSAAQALRYREPLDKLFELVNGRGIQWDQISELAELSRQMALHAGTRAAK